MAEPIKPLSLYELDAELHAVEDALIKAGGVIDDATETKLDEVLEAREQKIRGYLAMIRKFEASSEAVASERKRLQQAERTMKNAAQALKDRLAASMRLHGDDSYETPLGMIRLQRASQRSVVVDVAEEDLPEQFKRVTVAADKRKLQEALESGDEEAARYAHLDEPSYFVRIY